MRTIWTLIPALMLVAGCNEAPRATTVEAAWVRLPAVAGNPGAAYFTLNGGPSADRLMSVSSPLAIRAEMHDMAMKDGMMAMTPLDAGVEVTAGAKLSFAPGGKHVMLFDISPKVSAGKTIPLTLRFASGATLDATAKAVAPGDEAPHAH